MLHISPSDSAETRSSGRQRVPTEAPLDALVRAVAHACDEAPSRMSDRIVPALTAAAVAPNLVTPDQCRPRPDTYMRHVLHGDPAGRFTVLALVWGAGQFSPPHAHHAWCAYAVRSGELDET